MIPLKKLRILNTITATQAGREAFVSAASGLVFVEDKFHVVADDERSLASFAKEGFEPGSFLSLFAGELPLDYTERKKQKPDLEALSLFPSIMGLAGFSMLALPSGSKKNRVYGALIESHQVEKIDFSDLYKNLESKIPELNIEGCVISGESVLLFQRGNGSQKINAVIKLELASVLRGLKGDRAVLASSLRSIVPCDLGELDGVALSFTDACYESPSKIWFVAVGEKTESTYDDGEYAGAVLGCMNEDGEIAFKLRLDSPSKPEGLWIDRTEEKFYVVTDADDAGAISELFVGELPKF